MKTLDDQFLAPLLDEVVSGGYCVGCGACAGVSDGALTMQVLQDGTKAPTSTASGAVPRHPEKVVAACPFSRKSVSEDVLAGKFLPDANQHTPQLGSFISTSVVHCASDGLRAKASSGGFARWLMYRMLIDGHVSYVAHVEENRSASPADPMFLFSLTDDPNEVLEGAKSAYYPVSLEEIIPAIKQADGPVAISAIPCFAKALRQISLYDNELKSNIRFIVGIICGHMKSRGFAEMFAWQVGVRPEHLSGVDFRRKIEGLPANHKGFSARDARTSQWTPVVDSKSLRGSDWGLGLLKNRACDFCDDVFAEVADVSVGDAWLPEYVSDSRGHSLVVVRNSFIEGLVSGAADSGDLVVHSIDADMAAKSQGGGLRHRREGLAYRLWMSQKDGEWHPPKRVDASASHIHRRKRRLYYLRARLTALSLSEFAEAKARDDLDGFFSSIDPLIQSYQRAKRPAWKAFLSRFKQLFRVG